MEIIFIDSEPPGITGGGIRTYLLLSLQACKRNNIKTRIYTHNPEAFLNENVFLIQRKKCFNSLFNGIAYRLFYNTTVLLEYSKWLESQFDQFDHPEIVYEFADYLGYGYFSIKNKKIRQKLILRVHTPNYLVKNPRAKSSLKSIVNTHINAFTEKFCLRNAKFITVPSDHFIYEKLPNLKNWTLIPNLLPENQREQTASNPGKKVLRRFLYLGRIEWRKGVLPMLRAFLNYSLNNPECSLTLVGEQVDKTYSHKINSLISNYGRENNVKEVDPQFFSDKLIFANACTPRQRQTLFSGFDCLLIPSLFENSPYVYFEGMAAGLVCIGSNTGEMKRVANLLQSPSIQAGSTEAWTYFFQNSKSLPVEKILSAQFSYLNSNRDLFVRQTISYYHKFLAV